MIVDRPDPIAGSRRLLKTEADFGGRVGPIFDRRAIRAPMTQFEVGPGPKKAPAAAITENDPLGSGPRIPRLENQKTADHHDRLSVCLGNSEHCTFAWLAMRRYPLLRNEMRINSTNTLPATQSRQRADR